MSVKNTVKVMNFHALLRVPEARRKVDLAFGVGGDNKANSSSWILEEWNKKEDGTYDIFAKDDRTIIYAKYGKIEFRDTQILTQMPLKAFKKNFNTSPLSASFT